MSVEILSAAQTPLPRYSSRLSRAGLLIVALMTAPSSAAIESTPINFVIHLSIDGLRPDAVTTLGPTLAPHFYRLRREGVFTDNARTDPQYTVTLPNHAAMITGRPVGGAAGHNYTDNGVPWPNTSLHSNKGAYVSSVFDVVHDSGGSTGLFASKPKFVIYARSYDDENGGEDKIGEDNGRGKIDLVAIERESLPLIRRFVARMRSQPLNYSFVHLRDPDSAGHSNAWDLTPGSEYLQSVQRIDAMLGDIFAAIDTSSTLRGRTAIVLTSDHGGRENTTTHRPPDHPENYTIPFYVWGPGISAADDDRTLYELNTGKRSDPGRSHPAMDEKNQPIRNGDSANLVLDLLGFDAVPGSSINVRQEMRVRR